MTFADKSNYDRTFHQAIHKGGESAISYNKRFQNAQVLSVSVGNSYTEDQSMYTFLDNFHQSVKYSAQLTSHQAELRREEKYPDQKCLNISSLQKLYLNIENSLTGYSRHSEKYNSAKAKCTYCGLNNHSVENASKRSERKKRNLVLLLLHLTKIRIVQHGDALDEDLKII